MMIVK